MIMAGEKLIPANAFCSHHHIEVSFVKALQDYGLIEITTIEENSFIDEDQLEELEKMLRLHFDLQINLEGIDAIRHLLEQMHGMQNEITALRNRLRLYEG
jgi:hypothetical protein